jgi:TolB-like protein
MDTGTGRLGRSMAALVAGVCVALACAALPGCGGGARQMAWRGSPLSGHPRVALLPLDDLSGRAEAGAALTQILFVQLVRTGTCDVVESGSVGSALDSLRILKTTELTSDQVQALGRQLGADMLLTGTVLESSVEKTPDGDVPSVGVALKLIDARTAKVAWAALDTRSGDDHETVFGWGVQRNYQKLAEAMAVDLFKDFPAVAARAPAGKTGGARK